MKLLLILVFVFAGCSKQIQNGALKNIKMTKTEYIQKNGNPVKEEANLINNDSTMLVYADKKIQVTENKVDSSFRDPIGEEKKIQYWRHYLKDCPYDILEATSTEHETFLKLNCKEKGITILFQENGSVLRVVQLLGSQYE